MSFKQDEENEEGLGDGVNLGSPRRGRVGGFGETIVACCDGIV